MSLYYQHFLVPQDSSYRPEASTVTRFAQQIIEEGHVAGDPKLVFFEVAKLSTSTRAVTNPSTGEVIQVPTTSRRTTNRVELRQIEALTELAAKQSEYDVSIAAQGNPRRPPLVVGHTTNDAWQAIEGPYHLEVRIRVRSHAVGVCSLRTGEETHSPVNFANPPTLIFDEDCSADQREGLFVHPEAGLLRIAGAGCATFWIELNYGKTLWPRLNEGGVDLLDASLLEQTQVIFGRDFAQACNWG